MTWEAFLDLQRVDRARIVWCKTEDRAFWISMANQSGFKVFTDANVLEVANKLGKSDCAIITSLSLMRGIDYKSNGVGIELLVAAEFPTTRDYEQGLGRVGRYSEPSARFKWVGMVQFEVVNSEEELRRRGLIGQKLDNK